MNVVNSKERNETLNGSEIAVIGMSCRFPGAHNLDAFWELLRDGVEAVTFMEDGELEPSLVDPANPHDSNYVKAASLLKDVEMFDASFFGFTPREAEMMDPQHRLFLECSWEAFEHAGYNPESYPKSVGVFAGARTNTYLFNLFSNPEHALSLGAFEVGLGNDLAFLPTRVSYKFNLRGPSYAVHTACSTSLVTIHLACQSLLIDECQMALAGGVAVNVPQKTGYLYTRGGITSPDGHCRAFDASAQGTLFGSGVGVVVLKRLEDALADGDTIHAVIKATAANNDGAAKASFTAPSAQGQTEVIAEALANADVDPATITYIETHGTGTALGDPIEVRGITRAFRSCHDRKSPCALGSVKSNLGHLDAAAGIAGFLKTVLALKHRILPPSLYFERPNPSIDFDDDRFFVNNKLSEWKTEQLPRRAGISAFGVGGTNAHAILEESPPETLSAAAKPQQLVALSARTPTALEAASTNLASFLKQRPETNLADLAYTLQVGRKAFSCRRMLVASSVSEAAAALDNLDPQKVVTEFQEETERPVVFMFPGGGAQYANMARDLYEQEKVYRRQVNECCEILKPMLSRDLKEVLLPAPDKMDEVSQKLRRPSIGLPALFVVEYALARQWMSWGIAPEAMIGHSLGEYVAACLAGVFSLGHALSIVTLRGKLFEKLSRGAMLGISTSEKEARSLINGRLSLAAVNGPKQCVASGPAAAVEDVAAQLETKGIDYQRIHIEVAAHSMMVDEIVGEFVAHVSELTLREPAIKFVSNITGTWITPDEARDANYWGRHLRETVRFADGIDLILKERSRVLLEVGPGHTLSTLVKMQNGYERSVSAFSSTRHPYEQLNDDAVLMGALGKLWLSGVKVDWQKLHEGEDRRRLTLPTYPFERQRYWVEAGNRNNGGATSRTTAGKNKDLSDWFYAPSWKRKPPPLGQAVITNDEAARAPWLVFADESSLSRMILDRLQQVGRRIIKVVAANEYEKIGEGAYAINARRREDYYDLVREIQAGAGFSNIIHLWSITSGDNQSSKAFFSEAQNLGFYSLLYIAQAVAHHDITRPLQFWVITNGLQEVESNDRSMPEKATILGPCKVIPQERQNITSHCIDILPPQQDAQKELELAENIVKELDSGSADPFVALRGSCRWVQDYEPVKLAKAGPEMRPVRERGVYLITGGLGGVGLLLARDLAQRAQAKLILTGRSALPDRGVWQEWLETHDETDEQSYKIRRILALEELGAEVKIAAVSVDDEAQMRALITEIYDRFGALNGVIHAAGITSGPSVFNPLTEIGPAEAEAQFQPKVAGVYVLEKALEDKDLDFCLMTSSNSSVLGGMGFVAYAAANAFMDAFAASRSRTGRRAWISASWDPWPEETKRYIGVQTSMDRYAMTEAESVEAFHRVVTMAPAGHIVVATGDLPARLDLWIRRADAQADQSSTESYPRPLIQSAYLAPRNGEEQAIAEIWQQLLRVEQVGVNDNFFDLGGHSLLATRLVARLRDTFRLELPLQRFFQYPTVAGLAQVIREIKEEQADQERTEILELLAHLSEEEAELEVSRRGNLL